MIHSPFLGIDLCLEVPSIWPDVHTRLMSIVGEQLTPLLALKYLAELETQVVLPDVSVTRPDIPKPDVAFVQHALAYPDGTIGTPRGHRNGLRQKRMPLFRGQFSL